MLLSLVGRSSAGAGVIPKGKSALVNVYVDLLVFMRIAGTS